MKRTPPVRYEQLLEQIVTAEALGLDGAWCAEPRIPRFALSSPAYASVGSPDGGAKRLWTGRPCIVALTLLLAPLCVSAMVSTASPCALEAKSSSRRRIVCASFSLSCSRRRPKRCVSPSCWRCCASQWRSMRISGECSSKWISKPRRFQATAASGVPRVVCGTHTDLAVRRSYTRAVSPFFCKSERATGPL